MVSGVPLLQTLRVTVSERATDILKPLSSSLIVTPVPAVGLVHSIRLIRLLKKPKASREAPASGLSFGSRGINYLGFFNLLNLHAR